MASETKQQQRKRRTRVRMENGQGQVRSVCEPKCTATSRLSSFGAPIVHEFFERDSRPVAHESSKCFCQLFFINWCHRSTTLHTRQRRAMKSFCFLCTTLAKKEALGLVDRQAELSENNKADRLEEMTTLHILRFKAATSERREKTESQAVDEP